MVPLFVMADKIHAGMRVRINTDGRGINPFLCPQLHEHAAEPVVAQPRAIGDVRSLPCRGHGKVCSIAAISLPVLRGRRFIELHHGFAESDDVKMRAFIRHAAAP